MIDLVIIILALPLILAAIFFTIQLLSAVVYSRDVDNSTTRPLDEVVVVVPAHNEATVIANTLDCLHAQLPSNNRVLVVADNCTDDTAAVAKRAGASVIERCDPQKRGKGFALQYAIDHLRAADKHPEFVIFIDADCEVEQGALPKLVGKCANTNRPVQALYRMKSKGDVGPKLKIAEFAWIIKNWIRPLGLHNLGLPCQLTGTGMGFPFELASKVRFGSASIVEDMQLGLDFARIGYAPMFCSNAVINSYFPSAESGQIEQRVRWEHGHLATILSNFLDLIKTAIIRKDKNCLAMAFDLMIPPLALLVGLIGTGILGSIIVYELFGTGIISLSMLALALGLILVSILMAWGGFARHIISLSELFWVPVYVFTKLPVYIGFLIKRQTTWTKTDRD